MYGVHRTLGVKGRTRRARQLEMQARTALLSESDMRGFIGFMVKQVSGLNPAQHTEHGQQGHLQDWVPSGTHAHCLVLGLGPMREPAAQVEALQMQTRNLDVPVRILGLRAHARV